MYPKQSQAWRPASLNSSAPPERTDPQIHLHVHSWLTPARRVPRWTIALLVILALAFWKVTLAVLAVAVLARMTWHGYRATVSYNAERRTREAELRARCDAEDRLWAAGDSRGFYGLGFHQ